MANSDVLRSRFASTDLAKRGRVRECLKCEDVGDKKEMSEHVLRVHMEEDEVPFRCPACQKGFARRSLGQEHLRRVHPDSDQTIRGEEANWEDWLKTLSRDESLAVYTRRFRRPSDSDVELEEELPPLPIVIAGEPEMDLPPLPVATAGKLEVDLPPLPVTAEEPKPIKKAKHKPLIVKIPKLAIKVPEKMAVLEMPEEMDLPHLLVVITEIPKIGKIEQKEMAELEMFEEVAPIVPEELVHPEQEELELHVQDDELELQEEGTEQAHKVRKVDSEDVSAQLKQAVKEAVEPLHTKIFNLERRSTDFFGIHPKPTKDTNGASVALIAAPQRLFDELRPIQHGSRSDEFIL